MVGWWAGNTERAPHLGASCGTQMENRSIKLGPALSTPRHTNKMATAYDNLPIEDEEFDESQVDFTDLEDQYQVRLDEGLDAFVVIDGLPVVPEDSKAKLVKFVLRKLNSVGKVKEDGVHMPVGDDGKTEGYVRVVAICAL